MAFTGTSRVSSRLALRHASAISVKLEQLVGAFSNLTFLVEHEAASECIDLIVESYGGVALTPLHRFSARVGDSFP